MIIIAMKVKKPSAKGIIANPTLDLANMAAPSAPSRFAVQDRQSEIGIKTTPAIVSPIIANASPIGRMLVVGISIVETVQSDAMHM
jgi:hypothetical protein